MNYKEKKRSMFFGLPWTFTSYTVTEEIITVDTGLFKKEENDCYLYKVIDDTAGEHVTGTHAGTGNDPLFYGGCDRPGSETGSCQTRKRNQGFYFKAV